VRAPVDHYAIRLPRFPDYAATADMNYMLEIPGIREAGIEAVVGAKSRRSTRAAVETLAYYFRREFGYDFVQYSADPRGEDARDRAFLWSSEHYYPAQAIGAACFRWRKWSDAPEGLALAWIWFHPYERVRGHLTKAWPALIKWAPGFIVETSLSPGMEAFLEKHGWPSAEQRERYFDISKTEQGLACQKEAR
jgi:hypothetical protein